MASGMNSTMREAGTTAGIAVLGTLLQHQVSVHVHSALAGCRSPARRRPIANAISGAGTTTALLHGAAGVGPARAWSTVAHVAYAAGLQQRSSWSRRSSPRSAS